MTIKEIIKKNKLQTEVDEIKSGHVAGADRKL